MFAKRLAVLGMIGLLAAPAFAQTTAARHPAAPPSTASATAPATTAAQTPATAPVNVNTASAKDLDKLPTIGKARAAAIVKERTKAPFKDWADFDQRMTGTSVNAGVKAKIKDLVTF